MLSEIQITGDFTSFSLFFFLFFIEIDFTRFFLNSSDHRRLLTTSNTFELQPHRPQEVRTLGRPYTKAAKLIHHQIQV